MSHDQKPVKVRLLDASGEKARRRGDTPPVVIDGNAPVAVTGSTASGTRSADATASPSAAMTGRTGTILAMLFVLGCGAGGAAVAVFFA